MADQEVCVGWNYGLVASDDLRRLAVVERTAGPPSGGKAAGGGGAVRSTRSRGKVTGRAGCRCTSIPGAGNPLRTDIVAFPGSSNFRSALATYPAFDNGAYRPHRLGLERGF